jgi:hypothetical protein
VSALSEAMLRLVEQATRVDLAEPATAGHAAALKEARAALDVVAGLLGPKAKAVKRTPKR